MRTNVDTPSGRFVVYQADGRWRWAGDEFGDMCGGFPTLEAAVSDIQNIFGVSVRITHHAGAEQEDRT